MRTILLSVLLISLFYFQKSNGQSVKFDGNVSLNTFQSSQNNMPFYFWTNQLGQIPINSSSIYFARVQRKMNISLRNSNQKFELGTDLFASAGAEKKSRFVELYAGYKNKYLRAKTGWWANELQMSGLSPSNGNWLQSRNFQPFFRTQVGTNGFIVTGKGKFAIAGEWDEGLLGEKRDVQNAKLHHKNLFFRFGKPENGHFIWGLEHFAFWGGNSPATGQLPQGLFDYIRTIISLPGGKNANLSDQENVLGNQLGQYYFIYRKSKEWGNYEFRLCHPFEDFSGMGFINLPDNIYLFTADFAKTKFLKKILVEFTYSKHQSGSDIDPKTGYRHRNGTDDYLNHGLYNSGFSHNGFSMGTPLFYPLNFNSSGISTGFANNRMYAFHLGGAGNFTKQLTWKLLSTYSKNFGRYGAAFPKVRTQSSSLADLTYTFQTIPIFIGTSMSYDNGDLATGLTNKVTGWSLSAGYHF